jgi:hypothetical protein
VFARARARTGHRNRRRRAWRPQRNHGRRRRLVGHSTLIEGDDVRTGVTVIVPPETPLFAGCHRLNGNGELTGLEWVRESGLLTTPIGITNTFSVGVVRDAIAARSSDEDAWSLPVVGETFDGFLNDIRAQRVTGAHVEEAFADASAHVTEGNVGGGTGMICHEFKGGIGTASRIIDGHVVGVLVQANYGRRGRFRVDGVPVGELLGDRIPTPAPREEWARSSASPRRTLRCSRTSASAWRSASDSVSRASGARPRTRAATSSSLSRPRTADSTRRAAKSRCACSPTGRSRRSTRR